MGRVRWRSASLARGPGGRGGAALRARALGWPGGRARTWAQGAAHVRAAPSVGAVIVHREQRTVAVSGVSSTLLPLGRTHGDLGTETMSPIGVGVGGELSLGAAGRYQQVEPLGRGGMGRVDRVWD